MTFFKLLIMEPLTKTFVRSALSSISSFVGVSNLKKSDDQLIIINNPTTTSTSTTTTTTTTTTAVVDRTIQIINEKGEMKPYVVPMYVEKTIIYQLCQSYQPARKDLSMVCWRWHRMVQQFNSDLGSVKLTDRVEQSIRRANILNETTNMFHMGVSKIIVPCSFFSTVKNIVFATTSLRSLEVSFLPKDFSRRGGVKTSIDHFGEFLDRLEEHQIKRLCFKSKITIVNYDFSSLKYLLGHKCFASLQSFKMEMAPPRFAVLSEYLPFNHLVHLHLDVKPSVDNFQIDLICILTCPSVIDNLETLYLNEHNHVPWTMLSGHTFKKLHTFGITNPKIKQSQGFIDFVKLQTSIQKLDTVIYSQQRTYPIFLQSNITDYSVHFDYIVPAFHANIQTMHVDFLYNREAFTTFFGASADVLPLLQDLTISCYSMANVERIAEFIDKHTKIYRVSMRHQIATKEQVQSFYLTNGGFFDTLSKPTSSVRELKIQTFSNFEDVKPLIERVNNSSINSFTFSIPKSQSISLGSTPPTTDTYYQTLTKLYHIIREGCEYQPFPIFTLLKKLNDPFKNIK
ncbi:hypothetical protein DFA_02531 [Cavenderia fasciculata]|uniref:F-box domain-containing protein n=1 Tax=Cavenderia fasciculata TaxID=261658 RepID=F4PZM8_CACFS|nr:uncharacterized protein DFA_02531 [Cavenderia fasciculata]EGG18792.1 hypothetical protein DFA_02531 [Cavenderia fasciculata]|eukprot:XP_004357254.1 hypothetical protein DFA_02531 [Cavenderia fasciculata]